MSSSWPDFFEPLLLTLRLAALTTVILLIIGIPLAWWLSRSRSSFKSVFEALVSLPIILPPTVLGFYLLLALAPTGPIGRITESLGLGVLAFSFSGLLLGSVIYSLPFAVQPIQAMFTTIEKRYVEAAYSLGLSPWNTFRKVVLPLSRPGLVSAAVLVFAHTLGEFGVVLMIGGNIPGSTRVLSIALYDQVEAQHFTEAHRIAGVLLAASFALLVLFYSYNRKAGTR